jgi:periplasmic divalent cation tolerance protein
VAAGGLRVLVTTLPRSRSARVARALVAERLAACVTALPGAKSTYRWRGRVERAGEDVLLVKASAAVLERTIAALERLHPYEVPEILVLRPDSASRAYLDWALSACSKARS